MFTQKFNSLAKNGVAVCAVTAMLVLSACDESITLAPGAIDPNDSCARFQQAIVDARQQENQLRLTNAAAGALAGAVIGAAVAGGDAQNRQQGAIIGAVLGGVAAGAATVDQQTRQRQVDAETLREVNSKAGQANTLLTQAGQSASNLRTCRLNQIRALERSVRNGSVTTSVASSQLAELKRRANADNQIVSAFFNGVGNRVDSYVDAGAQAGGVERAIVTRQQAASTSTARTVRSATPNVPAVISTNNRVQAQDAQQRRQVENGLDGIEALLA